MEQDAKKRLTFALVAHDNCKADLLEWVDYNREALHQHDLVATGTTGAILRDELGLDVRRMKSGPLGGDLQVGAMIAQGEVDLLFFFWDPLEPHSHDPDVKALLRVATLSNIPIACNRASADFLVSSPLISSSYRPRRPDHLHDPKHLKYDPDAEMFLPAAGDAVASRATSCRGGAASHPRRGPR